MEQFLYIGGFLVVGLLLAIFGGDKNAVYPPKDEKGRPMMLSFSSRGGPVRWVRRQD